MTHDLVPFAVLVEGAADYTTCRRLLMSLIEAAYQAAIDGMTPSQKIERMVELNAWARWNIGRRIIQERGPLSDAELKWRVALWLYGNEPVCRQLIEEQLARVSSE